jgi:hypothetical protein
MTMTTSNIFYFPSAVTPSMKRAKRLGVIETAFEQIYVAIGGAIELLKLADDRFALISGKQSEPLRWFDERVAIATVEQTLRLLRAGVENSIGEKL